MACDRGLKRYSKAYEFDRGVRAEAKTSRHGPAAYFISHRLAGFYEKTTTPEVNRSRKYGVRT
jgi:hypothetical protein